MRFDPRWVLFVLLSVLTGFAQQSATGKPLGSANEKEGTVSGHVYLSDTKGPARKATVYLKPVPALAEDAPKDRGRRDGEITIGVETLFDGSFSFTHVAPGSYYVTASYPGYISPSGTLFANEPQHGTVQLLDADQQAEKDRLLATIPQITVQPGLPVTVDVTLERGAAVSGNVSYDDGTPQQDLR